MAQRRNLNILYTDHQVRYTKDSQQQDSQTLQRWKRNRLKRDTLAFARF